MMHKVVKMQFNKIVGRNRTQALLDEGALDRTRCVGTTTAIALRTIAHAIQNPGKLIEYQDHHGTRQANEYLRKTIFTIVKTLDLKYIRLNRPDHTICFDLWGTGTFKVGVPEETIHG